MNQLTTPLRPVLGSLIVLLGLATLTIETANAQSNDAQSNDVTDAPAPPATASSASLSGPLKIVKLLWTSNPHSAASTLTRSISTSLARGELAALSEALGPLQPQTSEVLSAQDHGDPRYAPALAVALLAGSLDRPTVTIELALQELENIDQRQMLWQLWLLLDAPAAQDYFLSQLTDVAEQSNTAQASAHEQWKNIMISAALSSQRDWASRALIDHWPHLNPATALAAIEPLTTHAESMGLLLEAVERGSISKDLINTNQLRKWLNSDNALLTARIEAIWGTVRIEDDAARQELVARTLQQLKAGASGSASRGAAVFDRVCSQCHVLHGRGFEVGPNIAQNGRGNLQQLVSNILDPSLVIGEAFQAKTVLSIDGQVVSGLVAAENDRYLSLKVQGGEIIEFDKQDIERVKSSTKSLMPEGVESQMQPQELLDLLAYLCLLGPLDSAENQLVPGTPTDFVQP